MNALIKTATDYIKKDACVFNNEAKQAVDLLEDKVFAEMLRAFRSNLSSAFGWLVEHEANNDDSSKRSVDLAMFRLDGAFKILRAFMDSTGAVLPSPIAHQFRVASEAYEAANVKMAPAIQTTETDKPSIEEATANAKVQAAFDEVAKHFPDVSTVSFDEDGRWRFANESDEAYNFPKGLDIGPLEDAADVVCYPSTYTRYKA